MEKSVKSDPQHCQKLHELEIVFAVSFAVILVSGSVCFLTSRIRILNYLYGSGSLIACTYPDPSMFCDFSITPTVLFIFED
jgi:hypothetical protein